MVKDDSEDFRKAEIADLVVSEDFCFLHNLSTPFRINQHEGLEIVRAIK